MHPAHYRHLPINFLYLKHTVTQVCITLHLYILMHSLHEKSFQQDVDKKGLSKAPAIPDSYLPGSCIAGVCLELLDVSASGTLISVKERKRAKGFISIVETKASDSWKSGTGRCCPSRDGPDRAEQLGNEARH